MRTKNESKVFRVDFKKETKNPDDSYSTIDNKALKNPDLSDSGLRLLILLLNQPPTWVINLTYFQHQLDWSQKKLAKTTKHLIQLGYLQKQKIRKEGKNGFKYEYTISESLICRNGNIRDGKVTNGNITNQMFPNRLVNKHKLEKLDLDKLNTAKHDLDKNNNIDVNPAKLPEPIPTEPNPKGLTNNYEFLLPLNFKEAKHKDSAKPVGMDFTETNEKEEEDWSNKEDWF